MDSATLARHQQQNRVEKVVARATAHVARDLQRRRVAVEAQIVLEAQGDLRLGRRVEVGAAGDAEGEVLQVQARVVGNRLRAVVQACSHRPI